MKSISSHETLLFDVNDLEDILSYANSELGPGFELWGGRRGAASSKYTQTYMFTRSQRVWTQLHFICGAYIYCTNNYTASTDIQMLFDLQTHLNIIIGWYWFIDENKAPIALPKMHLLRYSVSVKRLMFTTIVCFEKNVFVYT